MLGLAAGLAELTAAVVGDDGLVAAARELRSRAEPLGPADAQAYAELLETRSSEARERTVAIPLELAALAAEIAELASEVERGAAGAVRGDAAVGALLAEAASRAAALLVTINAGAEDPRARAAADLSSRASAALGNLAGG